MGSLNRKLSRDHKRQEYARFCKMWNIERQIVQAQQAAGEAVNPVLVEKLRHRPTFAQWMKIFEAKRAVTKEAVARLETERKRLEAELDLSWEDKPVAPTIPEAGQLQSPADTK